MLRPGSALVLVSGRHSVRQTTAAATDGAPKTSWMGRGYGWGGGNGWGAGGHVIHRSDLALAGVLKEGAEGRGRWAILLGGATSAAKALARQENTRMGRKRRAVYWRVRVFARARARALAPVRVRVRVRTCACACACACAFARARA
eukprot:3418461-Pleurochrysis_carterae.AAC.1